MSEKPGVMIYFTIREPISELSLEQIGKLFLAILDYAAEGKEPHFEDTIMRLAWGFIVPSLDADDRRYGETRLKRKYATYCREAKRKGEEPLPFEEWMNHHVTSCDDFDDQNDPIVQISRVCTQYLQKTSHSKNSSLLWLVFFCGNLTPTNTPTALI